MKKIILIILIIAIGFLGVMLIKTKKEEQNNQPTAFIKQEEKQPQNEEKKGDDFEYFQAKIESLQNPKIATKISGYIQNIRVSENQNVQKGEILVQIDNKEYKESLKQIEYSKKAIKANIDSLQLSLASLLLDSNLAKTQYETNQKLYEIGGIAKEKLEISKINYEQKKGKYLSSLEGIKAKEYEQKALDASLVSKEELKDYYTLLSPIDGKVEKIFLDIGDMANPNQPILSLFKEEYKLTFSFASSNIKPLQEVYLEDKKIGYIEYISPSSENFLNIANVKLIEKLSISNNSLLLVKVKIK